MSARQTLRLATLIAFGVFLTTDFASVAQSATGALQRARIEGRVVGPNGRTIDNARVTLKNDVYSQLSSILTDGAGRFRFTVPEGAYYIEVETPDKPFERKQQRVDLDPTPFSKLGEVFYIDIVLKPLAPIGARARVDPDVVFYQVVPPDAKAEFERGKALLEKDPKAGHEALRRALQIFPDYYDAMETLGGEYVRAGHMDHALPILLQAVKVNPSGTKSYYALGVLFYQVPHYKNAVRAFGRVVELEPKNTNATIYYGLSLMRDGRMTEAEQTLNRAYELGAKNVPDLQLALSSIYIDQKRFEDAASEIERLLRENPDRKDRQKLENLIKSLRAKASRAGAKPRR